MTAARVGFGAGTRSFMVSGRRSARRSLPSTWIRGRGDAKKAIERTFSPEFRNRLDGWIAFSSLPMEVVERIVDKQIDELRLQLKEKNVELELLPAARKWLAERGFSPQFGARPWPSPPERAEKPLAERILFGDLEKAKGDPGCAGGSPRHPDGMKRSALHRILSVHAPARPPAADRSRRAAGRAAANAVDEEPSAAACTFPWSCAAIPARTRRAAPCGSQRQCGAVLDAGARPAQRRHTGISDCAGVRARARRPGRLGSLRLRSRLADGRGRLTHEAQGCAELLRQEISRTRGRPRSHPAAAGAWRNRAARQGLRNASASWPI